MDKKSKRWYQTTGGIIFIVFIVLTAMGGIINTFDPKLGQSTEATTVTVSPTSTSVPSPTPPQTLEGKIKALLGDGETMKITGANDLDTNDPIAGGKSIAITMNIGRNEWDVNMSKERVWARAAKLSQQIFPLDESIHDIQITANVPTTDPYGNSQQTQLAFVIITRETYNKIHWDNFDYHNVPTVADVYSENHNIK